MLAYLVIREGSKWTDVFRLVPGQTVTIGRAPTNQIVIKDERCSRNHAEIFLSQKKWILRDLESRNGTSVGGDSVHGDYNLAPGDMVRIGRSQLAFVHDLSKAFPDSGAVLKGSDFAGDETVVTRSEPDEESIFSDYEPTTITHRRGFTKFLQPSDEQVSAEDIPKVGRAAAMLCRLAFELAKAPDVQAVSDVAIGGLFEGTKVDAGALLLLPREFKGEPSGSDLDVVASRTEAGIIYHPISGFLATTVLREGEALLARNVMDDSTLGFRDSKGEIHATSILCAPIRHGKQTFGLIHLYSTSTERAPDPDDLEFTLAVADTVAVALQNLSQRQRLADNLNKVQSENVQLRERLGAESEIVGSSRVMADVHQEIARAAPSKAIVLIRGESGVGKELVARAVHFSSPRRRAPFVCLNCAALAETLLASELFGHEEGAFTGATDRKLGKFEAANKGTLMLDEIGEMSPSIQAKFLRVLEGHSFERVGGTEPIHVDVRVIAATNRDLEKAVAEGKFRRDLYFRLHVLEVWVPPLRKRGSDVNELAEYFLARFVSETGRRIVGYTDEAKKQMLDYRWPGNVREMKNVVERAVLLARGEMIDVDDLMLSKLSTAGDTGEIEAPTSRYQPASLADIERDHILATLRSTGWNKSQAAGILGIERSTLDRKIRRYELNEARAAERA